MKKLTFLAAGMMLFGTVANAQAVRDRNVIPVAVNLNQVLRMTITNGGNIEFVFNSIDDYEFGLSADPTAANNAAASSSNNDVANPLISDGASTSGSGGLLNAANFYRSDFTIASSTRWRLDYGAEFTEFRGTDNPANTLALDNVGYAIVNSGLHTIGPGAADQITSPPTNDATEVAALEAYPVVLMQDAGNVGNGLANAGDIADNAFQLMWRCGTQESTGLTTPMNQVSLLDQSPSPQPDRYVTNVLFELVATP